VSPEVRREKGEEMRRKGPIMGLCAALIGVGLVGGSHLPAVSQEPSTRTFTRCEKNNRGFDKEVNVGKKGLSAGDWAVAPTRSSTLKLARRWAVLSSSSPL
jgi:hypothetical protein